MSASSPPSHNIIVSKYPNAVLRKYFDALITSEELVADDRDGRSGGHDVSFPAEEDQDACGFRSPVSSFITKESLQEGRYFEEWFR